MTAINTGRNRVYIQAESTLGGTVTGSYYRLRLLNGRYDPVNGNQEEKNLYGVKEYDELTSQYFVGTIETEYRHNYLTQLLLYYFLGDHDAVLSNTPSAGFNTYVVYPCRLINPPSFKLKIMMVGNQLETLHGVVFDQLTITVSNKNIVRLKLRFCALSQEVDTGGSIDDTAAVSYNTDPVTGLKMLMYYTPAGGSETQSAGFKSFNLDIRKSRTPAMFGTDLKPTRYQEGYFEATGGFSEYMTDGHFANQARLRGTNAFRLRFNIDATRYMQIVIPSAIVISGNHDMVNKGDRTYPTSFEIKGDSISNPISVTMVV